MIITQPLIHSLRWLSSELLGSVLERLFEFLSVLPLQGAFFRVLHLVKLFFDQLDVTIPMPL